MKKVLIGLGVVAGLGLVVIGGAYAWGTSARDAKLAKQWEVHSYALTVPTPLSEAEVASLREEKLAALAETDAPTTDENGEPIDVLADVDLDAIALERARERGQHLVESRYVCVECHGKDFTGGVMIDAPPMGQWHGPNLTGGEGSPTKGYTTEDWDRIVRHGVRKDGTAAVMPSEDFVGMSDQELSDIISYIQSFEPVDKTVAPRTFGPISTMLMATGKMQGAAEHYASRTEHPAMPPETAETPEFGKHIAQVCTGCHRAGLNGGPILAGDPAWPPASNLTKGGQGADYDFAKFDALMRTGVKANGEEALHPMSLIPPYGQKMTETEMKALWAYIESLGSTPTGT
ncbi:MAG: cytochrome c [Deltaproteobacteria bacterium]|nr:MAG: cytochrome c [Deltaproteobacteria bacterium]